MSSALRCLVGMFVAGAFGGLAVTALAAEPVPSDALVSLNTTGGTYLVVYRRGPSWVDGKPMREQQSMREHVLYYVGLHRKGLLIAAGGFTDESGGAAVFEAATDSAAAQIVAADPAVKSNVFGFELQRWKPIHGSRSHKRKRRAASKRLPKVDKLILKGARTARASPPRRTRRPPPGSRPVRRTRGTRGPRRCRSAGTDHRRPCTTGRRR